MKDVFVDKRIVPFLIFGVCGVIGMVVDFFDVLTIITNGPVWLHSLDVITAIILTFIIFCVGSYYV